MIRQKKKLYSRTYYERNRYELCKKTIGIYWENAVKRAKICNSETILSLYQKYPYEEYAEICFKQFVKKYRIHRNSYLYDECYSASSQAYMYTISLLSYREHTEEWVKRYLYRIMQIYVICVIYTISEVKEICKHNNLKAVDANNYRV